MARVNKTELKNRVQSLNIALGRPLEPYRKDADGRLTGNGGHILLDHNATYGGYILRVMCHDSTGESNFEGNSQRISAMEMKYFLDGILMGIRL